MLLGVLGRRTPSVFCRGPYQQIYEWRGAVNAMKQVRTEHRFLRSDGRVHGSHFRLCRSGQQHRKEGRSDDEAFGPKVAPISLVRSSDRQHSCFLQMNLLCRIGPDFIFPKTVVAFLLVCDAFLHAEPSAKASSIPIIRRMASALECVAGPGLSR